MKKILVLFLLLSNLIFAKNFSDVESFAVVVKEKLLINNRKKSQVYDLKVKFPDKIKKVIIEPSISKGEIYLYNGNKKTIYYPIFEEKMESEIKEDENYVIKLMKDLKGIDCDLYKGQELKKEDKIVKINKKGRITEVKYLEGNTVQFFDYKKIEKIYFPMNIKVYDEFNLIAEFSFESLEVNKDIKETEFEI